MAGGSHTADRTLHTHDLTRRRGNDTIEAVTGGVAGAIEQ